MKSKKLLILIAAIAAVVVFIVVLAAIFTVSGAPELVYHDFDGSEIAGPTEGGIAPNDIAKLTKGKSTIFLSKSKLLEQINSMYPEWHALAVVKNFPNKLEIHLVKRTAVLKIEVGGNDVYLDCFGYVVSEPTEGRYMDVTSAFKGTDAKTKEPGKLFEFEVTANNVRLQQILEVIMATWQCKVDIPNLPTILADYNVFTFDQYESLIISPSSGGKIEIRSPQTDLTKRVIAAYGVYYNQFSNLQGDDWVITVHEDGRITTPNPDKK